MHSLKLTRLALGAPPEIAGAGVLQVGTGDRIEAARPVEARGDLMGDRFVLPEAGLAGGADRVFVQSHRLHLSTFDAGDLGANERRAIAEILWAALGPRLELSVVGYDRLHEFGPLTGVRLVILGGMCERAVEV